MRKIRIVSIAVMTATLLLVPTTAEAIPDHHAEAEVAGVHIKNVGTGKCLQVGGNSSVNPEDQNHVLTTDCDWVDGRQQWQRNGTAIRNVGYRKCLTFTDHEPPWTDSITVSDCLRSPFQQWISANSKTSQIRYGPKRSECLGAVGSPYRGEQPIFVTPCSKASNHKWTWVRPVPNR